MTEQKVSLRFARALINTAQAENLIETVYNDLKTVEKILNSSKDLKYLTNSPIVQQWRKAKIYKEIFEDKIHALTFNFLNLLINKGRLALIKGIVAQYEILYFLMKNILVVEITTALEMNQELKDKSIKTLSEITKKEILPSYKVNSEIQGGIMVRIGDWVYDASIRNQLELLHKRLIEDYN